ncbi:peptidylprolyl isomerase [Clostridium sp. chh4-2]|uniref:peptidylprolyl isomerase n=1 Tax=Clostridium sp. chh4-2 TaxID=2067550 RepID=UPI000CCE9F4A|nr:peptidylprolyl isomerase [Clostridium sp. chh4-2]PNV61290.1 peptidylprolyl isomerase [Clostridium sp. chh4-2]
MRKGKGLKQKAAIILASLMLAGCGGNLPSMSELKESKGYSDAQTMIIITTEKNRYQDVYTDQIWSVKVDDEGTTFQTYLLNEVKNFMINMKTMNLLADKQGIELDNAEKETVRQLSEEYFTGLTDKDIAFMNVTREDVEKMYEEYHLANKVVNELTKDLNLEVSDNEAKVIEVNEIVTSEREKAEEAYQKLQEEGVKFADIAKTYSEEEEMNQKIGRGDLAKELEDAAFGLMAGEISQPIASGSRYYIFQCVNDYDQNATQERKKELFKERKNQAFRQVYDQFTPDNPIKLDSEVWNQPAFTKGDGTTTTNFFELYQEYFPN